MKMKISTKVAFCFIAAFTYLLMAAGTMGQAADSKNGIEGVWAGVLGGKLHLLMTISKSDSGELGGTLNSVDQQVVLPLSKVTLRMMPCILKWRPWAAYTKAS